MMSGVGMSYETERAGGTPSLFSNNREELGMSRAAIVVFLLLTAGCGSIISALPGVGSSQSARSDESRSYSLAYDGDYAFTVEPLDQVLAEEGLQPVEDYNGLRLPFNENTTVLFEKSSKNDVVTIRLQIKTLKSVPSKTKDETYTAAKAFAEALWAKVVPRAAAVEETVLAERRIAAVAEAGARQAEASARQAEADARRAEAEAQEAEARAAGDGTAAANDSGDSGFTASDAFGIMGAIGRGGAGADASAGGAPSSGGRCCVNKRYYHCASASDLDRCAGEFARCMAKCSMGDMGCTDNCLRHHPPDPSSCERDSSKDGNC